MVTETQPVQEQQPPAAALECDLILDELLKSPGPTGLEPGGNQVLVHKGDDKVPMPLVLTVTSAGYITLWDILTHDPSLFNKNMARDALKRKRADGSPEFTYTFPGPPIQGTIKCLLHPDNPERGRFDRLGLPVCKKANIPSEYQLAKHMQIRHPTAYATLEAERIQREREEDRKLQRQLLTSIAGRREKKKKE